MPKLTQKINSFGGGEIAPEVQGRTDIDKYAAGAARVENFIVHPEGGLHRRPGSRFVESEIDDDKASRLVPFVFSTEQAYVVEFSEFKARLFANHLPVNVVAREIDAAEVHVTEDEFELLDHGYVNEQGPFQLTTTDTLPTGLSLATDYYIATPASYTVDSQTDFTALPNQVDITAHGYSDDQGPFRIVSTSGHIPAGDIEYGRDLYISGPIADSFQLSFAKAGAILAIDSTDFPGLNIFAPTGDYVRDFFGLSLTPGGARIDITGVGVGVTTFTPVSDIPVEIPHPYTEAEVAEIQYAQSADFLFITHPLHRPAQLTRRSDQQWAFDSMDIVDGPYRPENVTLDALYIFGTGDNFSVAWNHLGGGGPRGSTEVGWTDADIGRIVRWKKGATDWGYFEVAGIGNAVTPGPTDPFGKWATVFEVISLNTAPPAQSSEWQFGSFSQGNYPRAISFFEQRLAMGGENETPQTLHGSEIAQYNSFSPTPLDGSTPLATNAVSFEIASNEVNAIRWMALGGRLVIGTSNALFSVRATLDGEPITPENVNIHRITSYGGLAVVPANISDQTVYVSENSQKLRGFNQTASRDSVIPADITLLASHIFGRTLTVKNIAYQQDRSQVLWCVMSDGTISAVTYVPEQEVYAWHRHFIGGSFGAGGAVVESMAVIPAPAGTHDEVWLSVKRTVNGNTVRHIEYFTDEWLNNVATEMHFTDASPAPYSGAPTNTITGLEHLEGETVSILADGAAHPVRTVSSGSVTLDASYEDVTLGLQYTSLLESLRLDPPDPAGSTTGKMARIDRLYFRLYNTIGGEHGKDLSSMDPFIFRDQQDLMGQPVPPFTGDIEVTATEGFQREKRIFVQQSQPLPLNILSINVSMSTGGK